ncbi:MAG: hypothetical protein ACRDHX_08460 [Chloroflexota bacterium]
MAGRLPRVVWDDENLHHLLVERADREITCEEVEEVLTDPETRHEEARDGRRLAIGRSQAGRPLAGRPLAVIVIGERELRPSTAWQITEERWREVHGE